MSIVYRSDNVAITRGGAMITQQQPAASLKVAEQLPNPQPANFDNYLGTAIWGSNNLLPQEMAKDIESTGVLAAGVGAKARIAIGKGPTPARVTGINKDGYEELEFINDPAIKKWLEDTNAFKQSYALGLDMFGQGNGFVVCIFSPDRSRMLAYKRIDPTQVRFEAINPNTGNIDNIIISGDWSVYASGKVAKDDKHIQVVPLLNRDFPLWDLQSRKSGNVFAIAIQPPLTGRHYYAPSPWYAAKKWVNIAQNIPLMKEAMFKNQITIKYVVDIHPEFWNVWDDKYADSNADQRASIREGFYQQIDKYLSGVENTFKSFISRLVYDSAEQKHVPGVTITAVDDKIKDGKMLPDSAAANIEILLPLMINAAVFGVDMPGGAAYGGGAGSGSNIREAYLVQVMLHEVERREICLPLVIASQLNGWGQDIVWRYPNQILTTLNTGANTQPTS